MGGAVQQVFVFEVAAGPVAGDDVAHDGMTVEDEIEFGFKCGVTGFDGGI